MNITLLLALTAFESVVSPLPKTAPDEPLRYAKAYSVEIDEHCNGTDGFYPLGVLGDKFPESGFNVFIGGNYMVKGVGPDTELPASTQLVYGASVSACRHVWVQKDLPKALGPDGKPLKRRQVNLFDPESLKRIFEYAHGSVTNAVARADRRIFKWEIDNEFIPELDFSPQAVAAFRAWLPIWYNNDLAKFRQVWGEGFDSFDKAVGIVPDQCHEKPGPFMDWIRFQQESFAKFLADYYRVISEADPSRRSVNGKDTQSSLEMLRIARARRANHELIGEEIRPYTQGVRGMDHYGHGDRNAYEMNFYSKTATPADWQPGSRQGILYGENNNHNGPGWQWAQTLWRMPANGLKGGNLFCSGWFGCWGDWASFGFVNPDASKREKFWYVPRFFATVHRAERFFTTSAPAQDVPKVAMLLAQRDIPFGVDDNISPWGFPINSRLRVYSHLRNAGMNVDVIPYCRLAEESAKKYDAIVLVSAERMTENDIENIRKYVAEGGTLICDVRCGQFDEHNIARTSGDLSDVLGLKFDGVWESSDTVVDPGDVWFTTKYGRILRGDGRVKFTATTAKPHNRHDAFCYDNKAAVMMVNNFGKGRAFWTNTQLGTLRSESSDGEEPARDFFRTLFASVGIEPAYTVEPDRGCDLRVECPLVDGKGNAVVMVAARTWRSLSPMRLRMKLPRGLKFDSAFISLAEENRVMPLRSVRDGDFAEFELPAIKSAAAIYLLGDHAPLLGTSFIWKGATVVEGEVTPRVKPGESFVVEVQVANPRAIALEGAEVKLNALKGWGVKPLRPLGVVAPGKIARASFQVTVPMEGVDLRPNHVQPLTVDLFENGKRTAVTHTVVQADVNKAGKELLLSDNWVSADCHWSVWTGASYRYLTEADESKKQLIEDKRHTRRADGSDVFALQSGDRADRRKYVSWQGLKNVELEWDLTGEYDVTRLLIKRGRFEGKRDPKGFAYSCSIDGKNWSEPKAVKFVCDEKGFCAVSLGSPVRARFVRFNFDLNARIRTSLDEIWIFGMLPSTKRDLVVYGGTSGGIASAIAARRAGKSVIVVEPSQRIGGLTTGGLGQTDIGNKAAFGGIALEFYRKVAEYYKKENNWTRQKRSDYLPDGQCAGTQGEDSMWTFEPSVALKILEDWAQAEGVEIVRGERLDRGQGGVSKTNGRIVSFRSESGRIYQGKMFVDATYEGDLMAAAGVSYTVGREANSIYGETVNGIQRARTHYHQFWPGIDPYVVAGKPSSGLLPGVEKDVPDPDGAGDKRVQAYCFRMCLTDDPANRIPFTKPEGYNPRNYELLFRQLAAGELVPADKKESWQLTAPWINSKMPNRKTDTNNRQAFASDYIGANWAWPEASYAERERIFKAHLNYQRGLMWTLANHPRVPKWIRSEVSRWGTCRDEFLDGPGGGWQSQLYVREARRMVGEYVMTEHNCRGKERAPKPIAMGAYGMDSHNVRRYVTAEGYVLNEGDVQDYKGADGNRFPPYPVDYGAIVPKRTECANLLVPVCISASHIAFGSIRMEPAFFALGHAAGEAAALAIDNKVAVQDLKYAKLRERLLATGQVIEWKGEMK